MLSCVFHERRVLYSRRESLTKEVHCNQALSSRLLFLGSPDLNVFFFFEGGLVCDTGFPWFSVVGLQ